MTHWLVVLVGAAVTGASIAYVLVVPRRWLLVPGFLVPVGVAAMIRGLVSVLAKPASAGVIGMAVVLCGIGFSAGYWLASASLPLYGSRSANLQGAPDRSIHNGQSATVVLSFAAPERYQIARTAEHLRRLTASDALRMPTSALPLVFLSERSRYRAIGDYLPARASTRAIADRMETLLPVTESGSVVIAWSDGSPTLRDCIAAAARAGARQVAVVVLGADGSFAAKEATLELESAMEAHPDLVRTVFAPSIWHSDVLASRLVARILETAVDAAPGAFGVVLVGEGQPAAWESSDQGWRERENYFNQRVRLLLSERGILEQHVRTAWLEWQTPDVTEAVRHLAALGCSRIAVAPSTIPCVTLATALDLEHMVASARVAESVRTVTLAPWGDDSAFAAAAADAVRRAFASD